MIRQEDIIKRICQDHFLMEYGSSNYCLVYVESMKQHHYLVSLYTTDDRKKRKFYTDLETYLKKSLNQHKVKLCIDDDKNRGIMVQLYTKEYLRRKKLDKITNKINGNQQY